MKGLKKLSVIAVALAVGISFVASAHAASALVTTQLGRTIYPLGVATPDSGAFTIEGNAAASITANDTTAALYTGALQWYNIPFAATQGIQNLIRFDVTGWPSSTSADTLGLMIDYGLTKNGPWLKSLNGATYDVVLIGAGGAVGADTTGWHYYWLNNASLPAATSLNVDANMGYSYTGWLVCSATQTSLANPLGWPYLRARVVGDHGVGTANSVFGAKVFASYYADLTPQMQALPR